MIVIVCGPPAVGKTTVAYHLRERLATRGHDYRLLHSDNFSRNTYDRLYNRVADSNDDWIVDGTFYRREWQERFLALEESLLVYLCASLETCLARNRERKNPIDEQGIHVVYREFEEPDADLTVDTEAVGPPEAAERIVRAVLSRIT